jgi:hypothetical protein
MNRFELCLLIALVLAEATTITALPCGKVG